MPDAEFEGETAAPPRPIAMNASGEAGFSFKFGGGAQKKNS
ncbi:MULTISPECIES: hypothetical protein [unclassified Frondihabitans]|nr:MULTISPECIES: hypothetical protein [unclassified Frondihabitans]